MIQITGLSFINYKFNSLKFVQKSLKWEKSLLNHWNTELYQQKINFFVITA